jgi:serine/threonine protein kinase
MTAYAEGALIGGKYRLERPLSQGGMGRVWVAMHEQLHTRVAVKLMMGEHEGSEELRQRFAREARAAALVKSPHVVHVFDYGLEDDTPYIAMELLEGEDLADLLEREGTLPIERLWPIVAQICKALRRMHAVGVIHRDLKPSNVFLHRQGGDEMVKVLDFGIAKSVAKGHAHTTTSTGAVVGSPPFMSPEQVMGSKTLDHRTDLWSLGVILFAAITGRHPFESEIVTELLVKICTAPIPRVSSVLKVTPEVDAFFERALARDPDARFADAVELSDAFCGLVGFPPARPSLDSSPISARASFAETLPAVSKAPQDTSSDVQVEPPPLRRRHRKAIAAGALLAVVAVGLMVFAGLSGAPSSSPPVAAVTAAPSAAPSLLPEPTGEPARSAALAASSAAPAAAAAVSSARPIASAAPRVAPKSTAGPKRVFW